MLTWAVCVGCSESTAEPQHEPAKQQREADTAEQFTVTLRETWDVAFVGNSKFGYTHSKASRGPRGGSPLVKHEWEMFMDFKRFDRKIRQTIRTASYETPAGEVVRFECRMDMGGAEVQTHGRVDGNTLVLETTTGERTETSKIAWSAKYGGFDALEQSLQRRPLQPGERRTVTGIAPVLFQIVDTQLTAAREETVELLGRRAKLLRVEAKVLTKTGQPIESRTLWTDKTGQVLKSRGSTLNDMVYRTTRKVAVSPAGDAGFDLLIDSLVKVDRRLSHDFQRIRYRIRLKRDDPAKTFVGGAAQQVRRIDERTAEITVRAVLPKKGATAPAGAADAPTDADRKPNNNIESDDPRVVALARDVAPGEKDPWKLAQALERFVQGAIEEKNFSTAFATAAQVAVSRSGDCTEHAVLLTALARARGIPSRVAVGLVYMPSQQSFGFHMWSEVYVHGGWYGLDATLGRGGTRPTHLKLTTASLDGPSALASFLPVARAMGQLDIEVLEAE